MGNKDYLRFFSAIESALARIPVLLQIPLWYFGIIVLVGYLHSLTGNLQVAYLISLLLIGALFLRRISRSILHNLGNLWMWLLVAGLAVAYAGGLALTGVQFLPENFAAVLSGLGTIAINATWEEMIFRGVLFARVLRGIRTHTLIEVLLLSNFLFTATHIVSFQRSEQADSYVVLVFLLGILLAQVTMLSGNLVFAALLHTLLNAINGLFVTRIGGLGSYGSSVLLAVVGLLIVVLFWLLRRRRASAE
jgi:membrane protease YdiL (CAAX protease family)